MRASNADRESPPEFAIANGYVIGHIPHDVIVVDSEGNLVGDLNDVLTDEMCAFLSPTRAYGYYFAYVAGAHRSIKGHFSFFDADQNHTGSVLNYYQQSGANPNIYVVLCGRMTAKQKEIIKNRARVDTNILHKLLTWFVEESGHPGFKDVVPPSECPQPKVVEDPECSQNVDDEHDAEKESRYEGATFHFTSGQEPEQDTGCFGTTQNFILAMLRRTMPTLLVHGSDYANLKELLLENVCVRQFPFGTGGPKMKRRNPVGFSRSLRHYCNLSLKQFMMPDFLLIANHMNNWVLSYKNAIIRCGAKIGGVALADRVSKLTEEEIQQTAAKKDNGKRGIGDADEFLQEVSTSCRAVGYSAEAAAYARRQYFAMSDYFGCPNLMVTCTADNLCTFRDSIMAGAGETQTLPALKDFEDEDHITDCNLDFEFRQRQRL